MVNPTSPGPSNLPARPSPLRVTDAPPRRRGVFLDRHLVRSPDHSDADSDPASDDSEGTIEDYEMPSHIGYPLQRMIPIVHLDSTDSEYMSASSSNVSSRQGSSTSIDVENTSYEGLLDRALSNEVTLESSPDHPDLMIPGDIPEGLSPVMIKRARTANEIGVLVELNQRQRRSDPWNPSPHLLRVSKRGSVTYLIMGRLASYQHTRLRTVRDLITFIRQLLEGILFLHEHGIAGLPFHQAQCYMSELNTSEDSPSDALRHYFVDFSAVKRSEEVNHAGDSAFESDVQKCGAFIEALIDQVPQVSSKFNALIKGMRSAEFGAEDSKKLFEALCKSIDSTVLDLHVDVR